MEKWA